VSTGTVGGIPGQPDVEDASQRSFGDLMGDIATDLSTLLRQEVELAKAEVRQEAIKAGKAGGMFGGSGVAAHMALVFLSLAVWWGLSRAMDGGWAAVIVAGIWAILATALYAGARKQLGSLRGLPRTVETVKQIPPALKPDGGNRP
jgi:Putative Actinobacterial Holin-X, holin superfamily III